MEQDVYISDAIKCVEYIFTFHKDITDRIVQTPSTIGSMVDLIEQRKFEKVLYLYGISYLLLTLKFYEDGEYYEVCDLIKKQIDLHNIRTKDNLPTSYRTVKI